jgi:2-polyprenyl-6-hydroxyphenyl methylase/3-demethylubiquinone-9 3-methyltransferase
VLKPSGLFIFHTFNRNWFSYLVIIKGVEWFVKNTPAHMHVLNLFIKPKELEDYCSKAGLSDAHFIGIAPKVWNKAFWKLIRTGRVDPSFEFKFRKSLTMGYLGFSRKHS